MSMNSSCGLEMSEWAIYFCLKPNEQYFSYIMARSYIRWDDNDVRFFSRPKRFVWFL